MKNLKRLFLIALCASTLSVKPGSFPEAGRAMPFLQSIVLGGSCCSFVYQVANIPYESNNVERDCRVMRAGLDIFAIMVCLHGLLDPK